MRGFAKVYTKPLGEINPTTSIVENEVFRYLVSVLNDDKKQENLWDLLLMFQHYPEPTILLRDENFAERVSSTEPGTTINYQKLRKDLEMAQEHSPCNHKEKELFNQCSEAIQAHVAYVRTTTLVLVYHLYDQLIDRFYGRIIDEPFQHIMVQKAAPFNQCNWPAYGKTKRTNEMHLRAALRVQQQTHDVIEQLKSSLSFNGIFTKLKSAVECSEEQQRKFTSRIQIQTGRKSSAEVHGRLSQSQRKVMILKRNRSADYNRALKNYQYKQANLLNTHQLGNQSRVNIPNAVIHALVEIQAGYQDTVLENDNEGMEGVDEANIHLGVGQVDVQSKNERGEKWLKMGIVIPDGFVDLAPSSMEVVLMMDESRDDITTRAVSGVGSHDITNHEGFGVLQQELANLL